ncbi:hypothetical protein [Chitinasiproducens palmae]|uniref:Glycine zipper domain-containing protein n=1 Tax=Chitinasiproducens palmae TaxID=1770053 RepID=A0A1H2PM99_9BURK|nr:hypothetical protein [Chitinasiproducens palmae]SDV47705.1 hypothetical protein SAMN05216551_103231 [Chitinasiproducens palmae]
MSIIVAGRFDTYPAAQAAAARLFENGFLEEDVSLFFVGPRGRHDKTPIGGDQQHDEGTKNAHKGAGIGSVIGAVVGAGIGAAMFNLVNSPIPLTVAAAGVGAWVGSLLGAMVRTRRDTAHSAQREPQNKVRHSGVIVAVHASETTRLRAGQILADAGASDLERANGRWTNGEWSDFDPVQPPQPLDVPTRSTKQAGADAIKV